MKIIRTTTGNNRTIRLSKLVTFTKNWRDLPQYGGSAKPITEYFVEVEYHGRDEGHLDFCEKRTNLKAAKTCYSTWSKLAD